MLKRTPGVTIHQEVQRALALIRIECPGSDPVKLWAAMTKHERQGWLARARGE